MRLFPPYREDDPLNPARGIIVGLTIALGLWGLAYLILI